MRLTDHREIDRTPALRDAISLAELMAPLEAVPMRSNTRSLILRSIVLLALTACAGPPQSSGVTTGRCLGTDGAVRDLDWSPDGAYGIDELGSYGDNQPWCHYRPIGSSWDYCGYQDYK